ncbi:hypothetical protein [Mesorhizobium sp. CAU 1732]|uniref:hypothetical protein n=1 Tax=Mesorhizobium sp. CAU 1732 TaxID=3140358 RepID=UPI0032612764
MTIFSTLSQIASEYRARRRRLSTYLEISSLPREIQKDIGWPGSFNPQKDDTRTSLRSRH